MKEYKDEMPLGNDYGLTQPGPPSEPKKGVSLFLPNVNGLDCLPEEGTITFRYERDRVVLEDDRLTAQLRLTAICCVEGEEPDAEDKPTEAAVDKLFAAARAESTDTSDEDTPI
jgi:hypothetical protein